MSQPATTVAHSLTTMSLMDALGVCHDLADDERKQIEAVTGERFDADAEAMRCVQRDIHYTIRAPDGAPVMVGGFELVQPHLARCWSLSTPRWGECVKHITRVTRGLIDDVLADTGVHRMEILSSATRWRAHRWYARSLGFSREALLKHYGCAGEDFVLFARTTERSTR